MIKKLLVSILLLVGFSSFAQNILILGIPQGAVDQQEMLDNLIAEFSAIPSTTVTVNLTELNNGTAMSPGLITGYDMVVIHSHLIATDTADFAVIQQGIIDELSSSFVIFADSCAACGTTYQGYIDILNNINTESWTLTADAVDTRAVTASLNTISSYSTSFTSMPIIRGKDYRNVLGIPVNNILYSRNTINASTTSANAYGLFIPKSQSLGSCVFYTTEATMFSGRFGNPRYYTTIQGQIGPAFLDAATNPTGSCARSATGNAVVAVDDSYTTKPDLIIEKDTTNNSIIVLDNDSELLSEGLFIEASGTDTTSANGGTISISGTTLVYTPATGFEGTDTFTYEVCVASGACDSAVVTVLIVMPPYAVYDNVNTEPSTAVTISVLDNDIISAVTPATITSFTQASNGSVVQSGDSFIYTPTDGFVGQDTFTYTICDSSSVCSTATVTITVRFASIASAQAIPSVNWLTMFALLSSILFAVVKFNRKR